MEATEASTIGCFPGTDPFQIEKLVQLSTIIKEGQNCIYDLYSYRLCANAIPQLPPGDERKDKLYHTTVKLLEPRVQKIRRLLQFVADEVHNLTQIVSEMCLADRIGTNWSPSLLQNLCAAFDIFATIDMIKNGKSALNNDFSAYNRAFNVIKKDMQDAEDIRIENETLQVFLVTRDHVWTLVRDSVKPIDGVSTLLTACLKHCIAQLDGKLYITPDDHFLFLRCLPRLTTLYPNPASGDPFKDSKISAMWGHMRAYPYVPLFGDLSAAASDVLSVVPGFNPAKRGLPSFTTTRADAMFTKMSSSTSSAISTLPSWRSIAGRGPSSLWRRAAGHPSASWPPPSTY